MVVTPKTTVDALFESADRVIAQAQNFPAFIPLCLDYLISSYFYIAVSAMADRERNRETV